MPDFVYQQFQPGALPFVRLFDSGGTLRQIPLYGAKRDKCWHEQERTATGHLRSGGITIRLVQMDLRKSRQPDLHPQTHQSI